MRNVQSGILFLVLSPLFACQQLVGWPDGDGGDDSGDSGDETAPTVTSTTPADSATEVALNTDIIASFDSVMEPLTTAIFTVNGGVPIGGSVEPFGLTATLFAPTADLEPDTEYTATITVGATDLAGNALAEDYTWTFTTIGPDPTLTAPFVILTDPEDLEINVPLTATVNATFSEAMDDLTIIAANFEVTGPGTTPVTGIVDYDALTNTGTFTPDDDLLLDTTYTATVVADAADLDGTPMDDDYVWTFSTAAPPQFDPPPIDLRSLASFVAVAGSTIDNSGASYLNGDVGLSPGTSCIGCTPPDMFILGDLYVADAIAAQAKADLVAVYIEARDYPGGVAAPANLALRDLTDPLPPGVYTAATSMDLSVGGTLALDAGGDPNAFWIFQMGSTLTINTAGRVVLLNGARAANVFWAVGTSSTINANASFQGTVMAQSSNSVEANATVVGRLLCTTGAITLLSNTITLPLPPQP